MTPFNPCHITNAASKKFTDSATRTNVIDCIIRKLSSVFRRVKNTGHSPRSLLVLRQPNIAPQSKLGPNVIATRLLPQAKDSARANNMDFPAQKQISTGIFAARQNAEPKIAQPKAPKTESAQPHRVPTPTIPGVSTFVPSTEGSSPPPPPMPTEPLQWARGNNTPSPDTTRTVPDYAERTEKEEQNTPDKMNFAVNKQIIAAMFAARQNAEPKIAQPKAPKTESAQPHRVPTLTIPGVSTFVSSTEGSSPPPPPMPTEPLRWARGNNTPSPDTTRTVPDHAERTEKEEQNTPDKMNFAVNKQIIAAMFAARQNAEPKIAQPKAPKTESTQPHRVPTLTIPGVSTFVSSTEGSSPPPPPMPTEPLRWARGNNTPSPDTTRTVPDYAERNATKITIMTEVQKGHRDALVDKIAQFQNRATKIDLTKLP